jgi:hypothetical protein
VLGVPALLVVFKPPTAAAASGTAGLLLRVLATLSCSDAAAAAGAGVACLPPLVPCCRGCRNTLSRTPSTSSRVTKSGLSWRVTATTALQSMARQFACGGYFTQSDASGCTTSHCSLHAEQPDSEWNMPMLIWPCRHEGRLLGFQGMVAPSPCTRAGMPRSPPCLP